MTQGLRPGAASWRLHCSPWATCPTSSCIPHGKQEWCPSLPASGAVCLSSSPTQGHLTSTGGLNPAPRSQHFGSGGLSSSLQLLVGFGVVCLASPGSLLVSFLSLNSSFDFPPGPRFLPGWSQLYLCSPRNYNQYPELNI